MGKFVFASEEYVKEYVGNLTAEDIGAMPADAEFPSVDKLATTEYVMESDATVLEEAKAYSDSKGGYTEPSKVIFDAALESTDGEVTALEGLQVETLLTSGVTYQVNLDGGSYSAVCKTSELDGTEFVYLGNLGIITDEDSGERFFVMSVEVDGEKFVSAYDLDGGTRMIVSTTETIHKIDPKYLPEIDGTILTVTDVGNGVASHSATEIVDCIRNGGLAVFRMGGAESGDYAYYVGAHEGNLVTFELMVNMASDGMGQHMIVNINVDADKNINYIEEGTMSGVASVNGKTGAVELTASDVGAIPTPNTAEVGQTICVSAVDENGVPTAWETAPSGKWRYLGRIENTEDVQSMEMTIDSNGNALKLSKVIMQGFVAPNNSDVDGYIKPKINGALWPAHAGSGCKNDGNNHGRTFRYEFEIIDGKVFSKAPLVSQNATNVYHILCVVNATGVDTIDNTIEAEYMSSVGATGWQAGIFGAGSYIDFWGVDA